MQKFNSRSHWITIIAYGKYSRIILKFTQYLISKFANLVHFEQPELLIDPIVSVLNR